MNVRAQTDVVRQVPTHVIWIGIDNDVIAVPHPVVAVIDVRRSYAEKESAEAEALGVAAGQSIHVAGPERTGKMSVLPWMIQIIARVIPAHIMSHPAICIGVHVRGIGVSRLLGKI